MIERSKDPIKRLEAELDFLYGIKKLEIKRILFQQIKIDEELGILDVMEGKSFDRLCELAQDEKNRDYITSRMNNVIELLSLVRSNFEHWIQLLEES